MQIKLQMSANTGSVSLGNILAGVSNILVDSFVDMRGLMSCGLRRERSCADYARSPVAFVSDILFLHRLSHCTLMSPYLLAWSRMQNWSCCPSGCVTA